jgi:hypothetical protein
MEVSVPVELPKLAFFRQKNQNAGKHGHTAGKIGNSGQSFHSLKNLYSTPYKSSVLPGQNTAIKYRYDFLRNNFC